ncbi:MAG: hypothetical protein ACXVO1_11225 [Tumebacillaceae bacterium]
MQDYEEKIKEQEREIHQLKMQVQELTWFVRTLAVCKTSDPDYPYWNWLLERNIPEEKKMLLENVLRIFATRYEQQEIPEMFKKQILGISSERLYSSSVPDYREVEETISTLLGVGKILVPELLKSLRDQGIMEDLCSYLLANTDEQN